MEIAAEREINRESRKSNSPQKFLLISLRNVR